VNVPGREEPGRSRFLSGSDVIAGISVAVLLIPQSLAYARVAGMPGHIGLYAAALPPLAAAFFASSPFLQTGPVAVTSLLTFGALSSLAPPGSPEYVQLGALLALVVGITRVLIGVLRAGDIAFLMSEPVIRGFTLGAALLILASQLPGVLGVVDTGPGVVGPALRAVAVPGQWSLAAIGLSVATLMLVLGGQRLHPLVPGVPLAAAGGIIASLLGGYAGPVLGEVPAGLPPFSLALPWGRLPDVALAGVVIALIGFAETASIARVFATRERQRWDPDRDFVSQGVASLAAGISGGFPVGGSFSRSSLTHFLGGRSRWSGAVTGLVVLAVLPFASFLAPLPTAVLSAIVIAATLGLVKLKPMVSLWELSRPQFTVATVTFGLTILLSPRIEQAVVLGILLAVGVHLWRELRVHLDIHTGDGILHVYPEGVLWFGSAEALKTDVLNALVDHPRDTEVRIHMERLGRVDLTAALVIDNMVDDLRRAGMTITVADVHPDTARPLSRMDPSKSDGGGRRGGKPDSGTTTNPVDDPT
jgi:SulP family sulfate permease